GTRLSGIRPQRTRLLCGDVRDAYRAGQPSGTACRRRPRVRDPARRRRATDHQPPSRAASSVPDGGAACLSAVAWDRLAVRAARCVAAKAADVARGPARGGRADLSPEPWPGRRALRDLKPLPAIRTRFFLTQRRRVPIM